MKALVLALLIVVFSAGDFAGPSDMSAFGSYHLDLSSGRQGR